MRGIGVDAVVIDEAADIAEEAWTAVIRPTLADQRRFSDDHWHTQGKELVL